MRTQRKFLAWMMTFFLLASVIPTAALAAEPEDENGKVPPVCAGSEADESCPAETHVEGCPLYVAPEEPADSVEDESDDTANAVIAALYPTEVVEDDGTDVDSWENCKTCSEDNPHMIYTTADLDKIRTHTHTENGITTITGYFKLANDIVFRDEDFEGNGAFYNDGGGWIPIGHNKKFSYYSGAKFSGDFNGDTYSVKNIKINHPAQYWYNGLFAAFSDNAHVYNLVLDHFNITADCAGVLCGQGYGDNICIENVEILNCSITGISTAAKKSAFLIANTQGGSIRNIKITNSSYVGKHAWGGSFITNEFGSGVMERVTITNCSFEPFAHLGLLVTTIVGDAIIRDIAITGCTVIPTHNSWRYLIFEQSKAATISLSNITLDITLAPTYTNDSGIQAVMEPKEGFSPVSMDYVTISSKLGSGADAEIIKALFQKDAIYISENIQKSNKGKLVGNSHQIVAYLNGGTFTPDTEFTAGTLAAPAKVGYIFVGWYDNENFAGTAVTTPAAGQTYYAKWKECTDHRWEDATCTEPKTCAACGMTDGDALGHSYQEAVTAPTCTEKGCTTHTCSRCDDSYVDTYVSAAGHNWDDGVVTKEPTYSETGIRTYTCKSCGETKTEELAKLTRPSGSGSGSSGYTVSVDSGKHGSVTVSPKSAKKGTTVTITVKPDKGYELDDLTVTDKDGDTVKLTKKSDTKYTFTMPSGKVEVEATFVKIEEAPEQTFIDVPDGYWAEDAIAWASENGYMNGNTAVTFNPEGTVSRQQLWMILARLSGYNPADMAEAKSWAVDNGISDGTAPGGAVSRQQLVTILYRYAVRMGYQTDRTADLTVYPDHAGVAAYAKDAMSWSVANSIVGGTTQGTLNPAGTATRAQFAVILSRFCENIVG